MKIIIFYEHYLREWNASQNLKKCFEERNDEVFIYSIIFERTKAYLDSLHNRPDVIFMPWFVDEEHEKLIQPFIKLNPKLIVINLHQEEISSKAQVETLYPKTEYTKNGSYHFVWGEYFKKGLLENGVDENKIIITGNIRNDERNVGECDKKEIAKLYGLDINKKWILFAENRGWITHRNDERIKETLRKRGMTSDDIESWIEYTDKSMNAFINEMKSLSTSFAEKYEFIYRPHPGTRFTEVMPSCVHIINDRSIYEWIKCCSLFLTCESTSIFEAEMCGKACATIELVEEPERLKMAGVHEYPMIEHLNDINDDLINKLSDEIDNKKIKYIQYIGLVDGNAAKRTVDAVYKIKEKEFYNNNIKLEKPTFYEVIRKALFEITTLVMAKLNIIDKLHFPRSAYNEANDIPYKKVHR